MVAMCWGRNWSGKLDSQILSLYFFLNGQYFPGFFVLKKVRWTNRAKALLHIYCLYMICLRDCTLFTIIFSSWSFCFGEC